MADLLKKYSVTPLDRFDWQLINSLPIALGNGLSIQNYAGRMPSVAHWDEYLSKDDIDTVRDWSVCLEHRYSGPPHLDGGVNKASGRIFIPAVACLRFLIPSFASGSHCLQIEQKGANQDLVAFNYERPVARVVLEAIETRAPELDTSELARYRKWIDWICEFAADDTASYLPLRISLNFSEKSYVEFYKPLRHVLRVMALEALFSDGKVYGSDKRAYEYAVNRRLIQEFPEIDEESLKVSVRLGRSKRRKKT